MPLTVEEFSRLTSLIYAAALAPEKWEDVLSSLSALGGGVRTHIFGEDLATNTHFGMISSGYDPDYLSTYEDYYHQTNLWAQGFITGEAGVPLYSEQMCARAELETGEFYADWIRPQEDVIAGGGMMLFKEERRMIAFGGNIRRKDEAAEDEWMRLVALVGPHLQQAFEISRKLSGMSIERYARQVGPERQSAVLLIDASGRTLFANQQAHDLAATGAVLKLSGNLVLSLTSPAAQERLEHARHGLFRGAVLPPESFVIGEPGKGRAFECHLTRVRPADISGMPLRFLISPEAPCLLLTLTDIAIGTHRADRLARHFGLTAAEQVIATQLAAGTGLDEIATGRGVSPHTVRNQLKSIMAKTGTHRQTDLIRLMLAPGSERSGL